MSIRALCWEILIGVFTEGKYANLTMRQALQQQKSADKALATSIVYGTIKNYRLLFYQFHNLYHSETDFRIELLLAMSAFQLFFLTRVPTYAVINEAVELAKTYKKGVYQKMVNALLRKVATVGLRYPTDLAQLYSFPGFIVELIGKQYNDALLRSFLKASNATGFISLRANTLKTTTAKLLENPDFSLVEQETLRFQKDIFESAYYQKGEVVVQDASSQVPVRWLDLQPGQTVLDVCAAPGTKASQIAAFLENTGKIVALDIHPRRLALLEKEMQRQGVKNVETLVLDGRQADRYFAGQKFDRILYDAPCSGLGVLKGKPEIKINLRSGDLDEIVALQAEIFRALASLLKAGGVLVYSTCTLNVKENQRQVARFLSEHPDYRCQKCQTIWPNNVHDGFFIAKLLRF